ncbi:MAG: hypothetical protein QW739_02965 [Candidatus Odinarchaeota archaeon]
MKKALWAALILIIPVLVFSFNLNSYSLETDQGLRTDEWWDGDYSFRRMITLTEPGVSDRVLEPVDVYIIFSPNDAAGLRSLHRCGMKPRIFQGLTSIIIRAL